MPATTTIRIPSEQLLKLRQQVADSGYLPLCGQALALLSELAAARDERAAGLRARIQELGYLPNSKALELLDAVAALRGL